jgi:signal transduction histidine kinase
MTIQAWPFALVSSAYLFLGIWAAARAKSSLQKLYGVTCILTAVWEGFWTYLLSNLSPEIFVVRFLFSITLFAAPVFYHFIIAFTGHSKDQTFLKWCYGLVSICALAMWIDGLFVSGIYTYFWGRAARAGLIHPLYSLIVIVTVLRVFFLLSRFKRNVIRSEFLTRQANWVIAATAVYCGGALDLLSNYGWQVFPLSFLFNGTALALFTYVIWRYEFLAMAGPGESDDERARREAASVEMQRLGMTAAFPLVSQGELLGFLLLGEKMSEEEYSKEDLLLLRIVANQAALAYQRVRYLEMAVHGARTEMLGEIAGGFAHEIKTPLANISLPAELSLMDLIDVEKGKRRVEDVLPELKIRLKDIMEQTFKASEKIEAVRQFSKPGQVRLSAIGLTQIFQNSLGLLDHLLKKSHVRIVTQFPASMTPVRGDAKQLEIVFVNLIKNAVEAMVQNVSNALARELRITGKEEGDWIVATVKDSGPGIKRADFGHLFEAYFTTKGSDGTGMGLFLSHQVIKAHGGSIDCKSEEGQGTEFIIRLPKYVEEHNNLGTKAAA